MHEDLLANLYLLIISLILMFVTCKFSQLIFFQKWQEHNYLLLYHVSLQEVSLQGEEEEEAMEQQRLRHLVGLQSQEIMALKDEIRTLSHKGGHILPPPHAPMAAPEPTHNNLL